MRYGKFTGLALGLGLLLSACGDDKSSQEAAQQAAAQAEAAKAEALKRAADIQKGIEDYLVVVEGPAETRILSHEKVAVIPSDAGDFYLVTIDGMKLGGKEAGFLQIGQIGYKLVAKDAKTYSASDLKLANTMPFVDKDGKQEGALKLTPGQFGADWSSELQTFLKFDFEATDLQASDNAANGGDIRAKLASWHYSGTDKGGGVSDVIGTTTIEGFSAKETTGGAFVMDKLTGNFSINGLKMAVYMEQMKKLQTVMAKLSAAAEAKAAATDGSTTSAQPSTPAPTTEISEADQKAVADYVQSIPQMFSGFLYQIDAAGLSFTEADGTKPFAMSSAGLSFGATGVDGAKTQIDIGLKHDGLALNDPEFNDPLVKAVLPKTGNLAISLIDVPTQKLLDSVAKSMPNMLVNDPAMAEAGAYMMIGSLEQLLQQSEIKLKVNPSAWAGEVTAVKADGDFVVNPQSVMGTVGTLNLALTGLDDLIKLATDLASQSPMGTQMMGMLQMLQSMAVRETGDDGKPVDKYKVDVKPTGEITVNDKPLPF